MLLKNKKILYFIVSFFCIFAMCIIRYLASNNCFWGDDFEFSIYSVNEHTFDCLFGWSRLDHGGYYIGSFLCKFMCFKLPLLLGIHPSDFIINLSLFNGLFFILVSFLVAKFAVFHRKSKAIFCGALCLFLFLSVFFSVFSDSIVVNYAFYRYFFSLIFYCIFWLYIYKNLLYKYEKKNDAVLWAVCLCGFILGTSIEIAFISSLILAGLIFMYDRIICHYLKTTENKDYLKSFKYNLDSHFYYPVLYLFIGVLLFTTTQGFIGVAQSRGIGNFSIINFDIIKEFTSNFIWTYVINYWIYWLVFVSVCIASIILAIKRNEIKKVFFPLFMEGSILTIMLSLVFCGKTYLIDNVGHFFLNHCNIITLFKIITIIPLFILISYIISCIFHYTKTRKIKKIEEIIFVCIFFILSSICILEVFCFPTPTYIQDTQALFNIRRKAFYITEKMLRFNYLRNEIPEIPTEVCKIHPYFIDYDFDNTDVLTENKLSYVYYARLYKYEKAKKIGYKYSDDALKKFYDAGGSFSSEELKNLKFSKLKDKDFVLNNHQDAMNFDEMQQELSEYLKAFGID